MKKNSTILLGLILTAIILRFCTFFISVINHDESTYLVLGKTILQGYDYWVDYIDTKPPGIFLIVAAIQGLLGDSIFVFRLVTAVWIGLTAYFLYAIQLTWNYSRQVGLASGISYILITSMFTFYGISPNTELFFTLFTALALLIILRNQGGWPYFLAGLALGFGFMIKYVVAFDALAFGLLISLSALRQKESFWAYLKKAAVLFLGFLLPIVSIFGYYYQIGHLDEAWFNGFVVSRRYPKTLSVWEYLTYVLDFFLRYLPLTIFFIYGLTAKIFARHHQRFVLLWSICVLVAILLPGNTYGHYFIQMMLPFCLGAGWIFGVPMTARPGWLRPIFRPKAAYSLLGLLVATAITFQVIDYVQKPDYIRQASRYLNERLAPEDEIYLGNAKHIIYLLTDKQPLHAHVHPSLFWQEKHYEAMNIDIPREVAKIKAAKPRFVLIREAAPDQRFGNWLAEEYTLVQKFGGERILIYELKE
ncbi:MAG TPA: glycosyltransferase family 39 protein [Saprospiraceae bacterium]|nr:glycosyltransferase family 39 protein [Saprospiraceae bacterium]